MCIEMSDGKKFKQKPLPLYISARKLFSPPIKSPKFLKFLANPEATFSQIKECVYKTYKNAEQFLPSCFNDLILNMSRPVSAFGLKDNASIREVITDTDIETKCCGGGVFSLTATLCQGLPGGAANLDEEEEWFVVQSNSDIDNPIRFRSFRLSCRSHVYSPECKYAGIVLYAYNGQTEWWVNGQHCKSGYTIILNTEILYELSIDEEWPETEGVVHGMVFYYLFRRDIGNTIGEGFAIMNGTVKWNSGVFNARNDNYHDRKRIISESGRKMLARLIHVWKNCGEKVGSLPPNKNFVL